MFYWDAAFALLGKRSQKSNTCTCITLPKPTTVQGKRADKKLARGKVPPLLLKIDVVVGLETAFAFLKMAPNS